VSLSDGPLNIFVTGVDNSFCVSDLRCSTSLQRITAEQALNHEWFKEVPLPKDKELMPTFPARTDHDRSVLLRQGLRAQAGFHI
jgi:hypothetical protein